MGLQQSRQLDVFNGTYKLSNSMALRKIITVDMHEEERSRKFYFISRNDRNLLDFGVIDIKLRMKTFYIYLRTGAGMDDNKSRQILIKTVEIDRKDIDSEYLLQTMCLCNGRLIGIPEIDIDSNTLLLSIYSLDDIFRTKRLKLVRSISLDTKVTVNQIVGNVLHQIYLHHK
jgi:hypothetical protein